MHETWKSFNIYLFYGITIIIIEEIIVIENSNQLIIKHHSKDIISILLLK